MEKRMLVSMNECKSQKRIRYGLITLIELADKYYSGGIDLTYIIKNNNFKLYIMMHVVYELKKVGLIDCREDNPNWIFLKEEPHRSWILEIVPKLVFLFNPKDL